MTREDKIRIINELSDSLRQTMLNKVDRLPAIWDGLEIRQWMADLVNEQINYRPIGGKRKKDYANTVLVENL
jgi:hypothetical protein